jgi:hypothetical protein
MSAQTPDDMIGPYLPVNGADAYGHLVNGFGRCQQLNTTGVCPTAAQQTTYLLGLDNSIVIQIANSLGINVSALPIKTNAVLVPLIIAIQFP